MHKTFSYRNSAIHYEVNGAGETVVLLHGFGESGSIWNKQVAFLQDHCRLIAPDLPGSGKSELLAGDSVAIEDYADCIQALLELEQVSRCIMIGHSMGGYIMLAFAEKYGHLLKGFGWAHSTAFADSDEKKETRLKGIDAMNEYGGYSFLKNTIPNLFAAKFKQSHPEIVSQLIEDGRGFTTNALTQYYKAMMDRKDRTAILKCSEVPVLFILGTEDVAAPLNDVLQQVHLPRVSYIHILTDVGHMGMLEAAQKINNHLLDFIRSLE